MINVKTHIEELRRLLTIEYNAEKEALTRIADRIELSRLVDRGMAWWPLRVGNTYYNSLNQRVIEVFRSSTADPESEHDFDYGRSVTFFTSSGTAGDTISRAFGGTVSYVDGERMVVAVDDSAPLARLDSDGRQPGVMLSFDETTYRAMFDALATLSSAQGRLGELRDIIYSNKRPGRLSPVPMAFPYLNASQQKGVNEILAATDVAVLHGPPGTGKTTTLVEAIYETLRRESQVMVCAQSNKAVDWICEKLVDRGINVLRIGNPSRVDDKMLASTYERRFEAHPDYPALWSIRQAIRGLYAQRGDADKRHQKIERLKDRAVGLELRINNDIFSSVQVVASTLVGSSSRLLAGMRFSTVFIDEAAQALEAACWIPMRRSGRMILAGDHCQLPPTVKSYEAMRGGLGKSLMERIIELHPESVTLLTTQYRMSADIMRFPAEYFYHGRLKAAPEVRDRSILDFDKAIEWVDTAHSENSENSENSERSDLTFREAVAGQSYGRINRDEARLTIDTLTAYIGRIGIGRILDERIDIGLISPYRAQVRYLRTLIRREPWYKQLRHLVSINTVDGFQGQERDVIVISLVRSNDKGEIGFLRDLRRINVAMTRARMKLIIIGDSATLIPAHPFYRKLYRYIDSL